MELREESRVPESPLNELFFYILVCIIVLYYTYIMNMNIFLL